MFLPKGSRIVVLDDKEAEAAPLLMALSKQGFSASYFSGKDEQLPAAPFEDVRIVFLDLKLTEGVNRDAASIASNAVTILSKLVAKNARYILVVWTTTTESAGPLESYLEAAEIKPLVPVIDLDKVECLTDENPVKMIEDKIKAKLQDERPMFGYFLAWENIVSEAAADVVNEFTALSDAKDPKLSHTLFKLAQAHAGKKLVDDVNEITKAALRAFGGVLAERIDTKVGAADFSTMEKPKAATSGVAGVETAMNAKLNIVTSHLSDLPVPGNVYPITLSEVDFIALLQKEYTDADEAKIKAALADGLRPVFLEVTPVCDYAQNKFLFHRVIHGILCPQSLKTKTPGEILYVPPFAFDFDGKPKRLILNKLRFVTMEASGFAGLTPIFRIGSDWLFDIQHKIAGHVSRPGMTSLSAE